jgi:hypothetical protein
VFFGEVFEDMTALENSKRGIETVIHHGRNLRIRINFDKVGSELVKVLQTYFPGVIFRA